VLCKLGVGMLMEQIWEGIYLFRFASISIGNLLKSISWVDVVDGHNVQVEAVFMQLWLCKCCFLGSSAGFLLLKFGQKEPCCMMHIWAVLCVLFW